MGGDFQYTAIPVNDWNDAESMDDQYHGWGAAELEALNRHQAMAQNSGRFGEGFRASTPDIKPANKKFNVLIGGQSWGVESKQFKSVTSNKLHAAVFPNMLVPVYMKEDGGENNGMASGNGTTFVNSDAEVPVMSTQCPLPGGNVVTTQTDPVKKLTWGPISRIEASKESKDLITKWIGAVKGTDVDDNDKGKAREIIDDSDELNTIKTKKEKGHIRAEVAKKAVDQAATQKGVDDVAAGAASAIGEGLPAEFDPLPAFHIDKDLARHVKIDTSKLPSFLSEMASAEAPGPSTKVNPSPEAVKEDVKGPQITKADGKHQAKDKKSKGNKSKKSKGNKSKKSKKNSLKEVKRHCEKALARLNLADHIAKIVTYGTVRTQSSVTRQVNDFGETRTVKTWIEVTETYQVPAGQRVSLEDLVNAVGEDAAAAGESWVEDSDGWSSDSESSSSATGMPVRRPDMSDPNETEAEGLLRSISRLEGDASVGTISRLTSDFNALIAGLRGAGVAEENEEGAASRW